ncbi:unnamed protein product [Amoebophrya sp. A120]|nr:unnamed protein product [Amoebophrya sp. A120]|eukprot:GSA120T00018364001.1
MSFDAEFTDTTDVEQEEAAKAASTMQQDATDPKDMHGTVCTNVKGKWEGFCVCSKHFPWGKQSQLFEWTCVPNDLMQTRWLRNPYWLRLSKGKSFTCAEKTNVIELKCAVASDVNQASNSSEVPDMLFVP